MGHEITCKPISELLLPGSDSQTVTINMHSTDDRVLMLYKLFNAENLNFGCSGSGDLITVSIDKLSSIIKQMKEADNWNDDIIISSLEKLFVSMILANESYALIRFA